MLLRAACSGARARLCFLSMSTQQNVIDLRDQKQAIRKTVKATLRQLSQETLQLESKRCYVPLVEDRSSNMRLLHLDDMSGVVSTPPWDILEPTRTYGDGSMREDALQMDAPLELLLMPGQAFTPSGARLGRGGGYYDKFVAAAQQRARDRGWQSPLLVALAFGDQMVEALPMTDMDRSVDVIVTPTHVYKCSERAKKL